MNKSELKKHAIDMMSASGSLFQEGRYREALDKAEQAWNAYFELQKSRNEDEDFSDLIYAARTLYEKCKDAAGSTTTEEPSLKEQYEKMLQLKEKGENGDHEAAILAADWLINPDNWNYLYDNGLTTDGEHLTSASTLYQSVLNNTEIWIEYRVLAAYRLGNMLFLPMFRNVDMENAAECFIWAADNILALDKPTDWLLKGALERVVETTMYLNKVQTAVRYAQLAMGRGIDMGIFFYIAYYGIRHKQKSAKDLINAMVEAETWQGLFLQGLEAFWECNESGWEDESLIQKLAETADKLAIYYDEHNDTEGGYACMAFTTFYYFIINGIEFFDSEMMEYMNDGLHAENTWCQCYYGRICDMASDIYKENGDMTKADIVHQNAIKYLCIAANKGNRAAIKSYIDILKEDNADPTLIADYQDIARQYDITD